jgi:hypothetical protein
MFAGAQRGDERVDHASLDREIDLGRGRTLDAPTRSARELARGRGRSADDRRDLVERDREHIVKHEREPLGGVELVEHDQQREARPIPRARDPPSRAS